MINEAIKERQLFLAAIGLICASLLVFFMLKKLFRAFRLFLFARMFPPNLKAYGEWAVITGGSSGIGRSYAREIARHGVNVVIIGTNLEALKLTSAEIQTDYPVECSYIRADLTKGKEAYELVERELAGKDVGILLNSAGIAGNYPCYFLEETEENLITMIDLHIESVVQMTLKMLPSMLKKKKGIIINMSSMFSFKPKPLFSIYSSCKAFCGTFTKAVCWEYEDMGIQFQLVTPSIVKTRMTKKLAMPRLMTPYFPPADEFAQSAVGTIGRTENTTGYWLHEFSYFFLEHISDTPFKLISNPIVLKHLLRKNMYD